MRFALGIAVAGSLVLAFAMVPACGGGGGGTGISGSGSLGETGARILLTDAPADLKSVIVNITDIAVHQPGGPWQSLALTASNEDTNHDGVDDVVAEADGSVTVDLIALRGTTAMMASNTLAPGKYTMIRFIVSGDGTAITEGGDVIALSIPSGTKTGIKIGKTFTVEPGFLTDVLLDWDAASSVHIKGKSGKGILKPRITSPENTPASLRWELLEPAPKPPARGLHDMVFDAACDVIVAYGGQDIIGGLNFGDTWEYNPTTNVWTMTVAETFPATVPPSDPQRRRGHRMAYDSARDRTVLFGGFVPGGGLRNDTWEYDSGTWTEVVTATLPSKRFAFDMDYDQKRGVIVLFGKNGASDETWEYDGTDWALRAPVAKPSPRSGASIVYDSIDEVIVLFGGRGPAPGNALFNDLWTYDGTTWTNVVLDGAPGSPPRRSRHDMAFDASRNQLVIFGGKGGTPTAAGAFNLGDTMEFDGASWITTFADGDPSAPPKRFSQAMVIYDDHRNRVMLFGGLDDTLAPKDDLWVYGWLPLDM